MTIGEEGRRAIVAERMRRQRLAEPIAKKTALHDLFSHLQPVAPLAMSYPGTPPRLTHRTTFDDGEALDEMRGRREIVKGRFQKGRVAYVLASELELYATAFRRPLAALNDIQERVLDVVREVGPVNGDQIKEETDRDGGEPLLKKQIMPALHRMQEACLVFEDQTETDWDRGWADFETEWPDVDLEKRPWEDAASEVVKRFLGAMVFARTEQLVDWAGWPATKTRKLMAILEADGVIHAAEVDGLGEGYVLEPPDYADTTPAQTRMMHRADFLSYAHASELKNRYSDFEVLQYLLIDGEFKGAVLGHWRIGPHDVDDVLVELPKKARAARKAEVLSAVRTVYSGPNHAVLAYDGAELRP